MSVKAYARHRGCSQKSVQVAIKSGRINRNAEGLIDSDQADKDWAANTGPPRGRFALTGHRSRGSETPASAAADPDIPPSTASQTQLNFAQARAAREVFQARLTKIELEERQGNLIKRRDVDFQARDCARITRDAILNVPDRVAALLAAENDPAVVRELLDTELRTVLERLAMEIPA
jgi:hypothetical protein